VKDRHHYLIKNVSVDTIWTATMRLKTSVDAITSEDYKTLTINWMTRVTDHIHSSVNMTMTPMMMTAMTKMTDKRSRTSNTL
jgi:hypothetical protein